MKDTALGKMFSLQGKTVVLTGGGGILVGEMAIAAAQCGANTVILDISKDSADKVSNTIKDKNLEAISLQCNVLDKDNLQECCRKIIDKYGKIDCLVNGAGGNRSEATTSDTLSFFDIPITIYKDVLDLNLTGTVLPCQVFGKEIAKQKQGSIVNIASISGFRPLTRASAYAAGKAAVINFTKWLAVYICQNYSPQIRVNAIAPGFFSTQQNKYLLYDDNGQLTKRGRTIIEKVPQNRFGNPEELTGILIWLLGESSSFCTGTVITVDGGFDAFSGV
jgi:NAD(P)-dependent dehydrogenase (short-subunit alcohol dehydrogenase family)